MKKDSAFLQELAILVHSGLVGGHTLGAYYNYRKGNKVDGWVLFHLAAAILSATAVHNHYKQSEFYKKSSENKE